MYRTSKFSWKLANQRTGKFSTAPVLIAIFNLWKYGKYRYLIKISERSWDKPGPWGPLQKARSTPGAPARWSSRAGRVQSDPSICSSQTAGPLGLHPDPATHRTSASPCSQLKESCELLRLWTMLGIRIRRISTLLGLKDPHPAPNPDSSIIKQK